MLQVMWEDTANMNNYAVAITKGRSIVGCISSEETYREYAHLLTNHSRNHCLLI